MSKNKTSKYFKYAIGEIILVVIGILIALQINNWNESRKEKLEENAILKNLNDEFSSNKKLLDDSKLETKIAKNAGFKLMKLFGKSEAYISEHNTDSLLFVVLEPGEFRASDNTINDLIQSGRLKLIQNKNLKTLLYQWQSALKDFDVAYRRIEMKIDDALVPYLSKKYAFKDIDKYGALNWKENSNLEINKFEIFNQIEFENIIDDYLYRIITSERSLNNIEHVLKSILKETNYN